MFENVDGRTDDGVTGILIAHLGAFGSGELIIIYVCDFSGGGGSGPPVPALDLRMGPDYVYTN